ncbi:hypothetical protein Btru_058624 [Bulinus truncatus]|nr:hypothetical protein Btru_058624 [Bulinus truncatus]
MADRVDGYFIKRETIEQVKQEVGCHNTNNPEDIMDMAINLLHTQRKLIELYQRITSQRKNEPIEQGSSTQVNAPTVPEIPTSNQVTCKAKSGARKKNSTRVMPYSRGIGQSPSRFPAHAIPNYSSMIGHIPKYQCWKCGGHDHDPILCVFNRSLM